MADATITPTTAAPTPTAPSKPASPAAPVVPARPDAILVREDYPGGITNDGDRHAPLRREFGKVLGSKLVHLHNLQVGTLLSATGTAHRYHAKGSPFEGKDRYTWVNRGDGVYYGTLTAAALAEGEGPLQSGGDPFDLGMED